MSPRTGAWSIGRHMFRQAQHDSFLMSPWAPSKGERGSSSRAQCNGVEQSYL